ncbi:MAG: GNAT family N-acetyltransferase [Gammaproteobacteria bacterium]|nr:GNAT family N-acetyltransferase [Gammaproteobacteria bacterium]MDP7455642.1 GNAT family N-acetyltransferase [Gammaproteobacteria bacterium]HJO11927.1 GNAT family N-acetyltransferase [Gammaproteobacteria bacterium]
MRKPRGLSSRLFFCVYSGPNAIAFARLSSRTSAPAKHARSEQDVPGVSYCLKNIEVSQNYRNKGIGSALLDEIIHFCKDERVSSIYGEAKGNISVLRRWYEQKGFELDNTNNIQLSLP